VDRSINNLGLLGLVFPNFHGGDLSGKDFLSQFQFSVYSRFEVVKIQKHIKRKKSTMISKNMMNKVMESRVLGGLKSLFPSKGSVSDRDLATLRADAETALGKMSKAVREKTYIVNGDDKDDAEKRQSSCIGAMRYELYRFVGWHNGKVDLLQLSAENLRTLTKLSRKLADETNKFADKFQDKDEVKEFFIQVSNEFLKDNGVILPESKKEKVEMPVKEETKVVATPATTIVEPKAVVDVDDIMSASKDTENRGRKKLNFISMGCFDKVMGSVIMLQKNDQKHYALLHKGTGNTNRSLSAILIRENGNIQFGPYGSLSAITARLNGGAVVRDDCGKLWKCNPDTQPLTAHLYQELKDKLCFLDYLFTKGEGLEIELAQGKFTKEETGELLPKPLLEAITQYDYPISVSDYGSQMAEKGVVVVPEKKMRLIPEPIVTAEPVVVAPIVSETVEPCVGLEHAIEPSPIAESKPDVVAESSTDKLRRLVLTNCNSNKISMEDALAMLKTIKD